ncbi:ABC transporter ATP-binding protein [Polycladomyces sp. WAk]|uniref:ABC transporter ATP-binding protein n=1 Tax=Polycladomyces zharkentensis TaxID=2807616 RepID=A0ABS2WH53_9BACL|nr:ABC transporter ATP-binding protein [Polycladomyces sp. WAk]MBN2908836.1 ABC transporter ATP-binding protein [Polycladomyces sp. WAk]
MSLLQIHGLEKSYGKHRALKGIDLEIEPGTFGLLGPNGAGKTTLMRILTTLIPASKGRIRFGNKDWSNPENIRPLIGYLPQKFSLYQQIRVHQALLHIATLKGVRDKERQVRSVLEKVNLMDQKNKKIGELSGGMVRRLGIAQAIIGDPKIIVVDEPTAGLDPEERIRFRKLLRNLGKDSIVIISTHIVEDIESTCHKTAVLYQGNVIANGTIDEIAAKAKGKVWEFSLSQEEFYRSAEEWEVISSHKTDQMYQLRVLSDEEPPNARECTPTLEDGYLYLMKSERRNDR